MKGRIHHNQLWLTATEAAVLTKHHPKTIWNWGRDGLIKVRANPSKKKRMAWQYYLPDLEKIIN